MALGMYWQYQVRDQEIELGYWLDQVIEANQGRDEPLLVYAEAVRLSTDRRNLEPENEGRMRSMLRSLLERMDRAPEPPFPGLVVLRARLPLFLDPGEAPSIEEMTAAAAGFDDPWMRGAIYAAASWMAENAGARDQMAYYTECAHRAFSETGDAWGLSAVLSQRAQLLTLDGEIDQAIAVLQQALELAPVIGSGDDVLITRLRLAGLELRRGNTAAARAHVQLMREAERSSTMERERDLLCDAVDTVVLLAEGRNDRAEQMAAQLRNSIDESLLANRFSSHASALALFSSAAVEVSLDAEEDHPPGSVPRPRLDRAIADLRRGYGAAVLTADMPIMAEYASVLAAVAYPRGDHELAAKLLGASAALVGVDRLIDPNRDELTDRLRTAMGRKMFDDQFAAGRRLDRSAIIDLMNPDNLSPPSSPAPHPPQPR